MTEAELVKRAKRGDVDAFAKLYEQIYIRLYQFALYTHGNPHDAEDAVSETATDCFEQIKSLRRDEAFSAWMFRILSNKCKQRMRGYYQARQELSLSDLSEEELGFSDTKWTPNESVQSDDVDLSGYYGVYEWTDKGFEQVLKIELTTNSSYTVRGLYSGNYLYVVNMGGSNSDEDIVTIRSYDMSDEYREIDSLTVQ